MLFPEILCACCITVSFYLILTMVIAYGEHVMYRLIIRSKNSKNRAAKIITGSARMDSSTEARNKLKWLNVKERYQFHLAINMFKVMNGQAPNYLANRFNIKDSGYALRGYENLSIPNETKNRVFFTKKIILLLWCDIVEFPTRCNKKFVQSIAIQEEIFQ